MLEKEKNKPILNIEQAKRYFISMGCSHFHLSREDYQRADEYYALKISSYLESQWRKEAFEGILSKISSADPENCGRVYFSLKNMIEQNDFYLEKMAELTDKIIDFLPTDQMQYVLSAIIGNNGSKARGGLIQETFEFKRLDLTNKFVSHAKVLLERAEAEKVSLVFVRSYLADVIEYFKLKEDKAYLNQLRKKDNVDSFQYYKKGAEEGNKFSMIRLAEYYRKGIGCNKDIKQAENLAQKIWTKDRLMKDRIIIRAVECNWTEEEIKRVCEKHNVYFVEEVIKNINELRQINGKTSKMTLKNCESGSEEDPIDLIMAITPGAAQRNWRVPSEFPCCPPDSSKDHIATYATNLKAGNVFCLNNVYKSLVLDSAVKGQSILVITESRGSSIKPWAVAKITYEDGLYIHESLGSFFTDEGAKKVFTIEQGLEWTDGDTFDDYC
jgi:hypothetical protein